MLRFRVAFPDIPVVDRWFEGYSSKMEDLSPAFSLMKDRFYDYMGGVFSGGGPPDARWAPLNPRYLRWKLRQGYPPNPLIRTGRFRASLSSEGGPYSVLSIGRQHLIIGARFVRGGWDIGMVHQRGAPRRNIPPRPLFTDYMYRTLLDDWVQILRDHLLEE